MKVKVCCKLFFSTVVIARLRRENESRRVSARAERMIELKFFFFLWVLCSFYSLVVGGWEKCNNTEVEIEY